MKEGKIIKDLIKSYTVAILTSCVKADVLKTIKFNNLKTFSDPKIMDTSAVLLVNKQALKNRSVAKIVKLLS